MKKLLAFTWAWQIMTMIDVIFLGLGHPLIPEWAVIAQILIVGILHGILIWRIRRVL